MLVDIMHLLQIVPAWNAKIVDGTICFGQRWHILHFWSGVPIRPQHPSSKMSKNPNRLAICRSLEKNAFYPCNRKVLRDYLGPLDSQEASMLEDLTPPKRWPGVRKNIVKSQSSRESLSLPGEEKKTFTCLLTAFVPSFAGIWCHEMVKCYVQSYGRILLEW